ncbi:hypothetical protein Dimus_033275 [Dionaea muscipula]
MMKVHVIILSKAFHRSIDFFYFLFFLFGFFRFSYHMQILDGYHISTQQGRGVKIMRGILLFQLFLCLQNQDTADLAIYLLSFFLSVKENLVTNQDEVVTGTQVCIRILVSLTIDEPNLGTTEQALYVGFSAPSDGAHKPLSMTILIAIIQLPYCFHQ